MTDASGASGMVAATQDQYLRAFCLLAIGSEHGPSPADMAELEGLVQLARIYVDATLEDDDTGGENAVVSLPYRNLQEEARRMGEKGLWVTNGAPTRVAAAAPIAAGPAAEHFERSALHFVRTYRSPSV